LKDQLRQILDGSRAAISTIKPSDWVEANLVMRKPFPGPFRYDRTPYTREIIDCLDPNHPAKWIAFMKGAQIGASAGVIIPGIGWLIANNPANTYLTVGSTPLIEKAMQKIDMMLKDSGIHHLIGPTVQRRKNQKSGDTNTVKEFAGGAVWVSTPNNHEAIRQIDLQYGFIDDAEAIKQASEKAGDTVFLLEKRFSAYADSKKIFYISSPELAASSIIEPQFKMGDQRYYHIPCPCCQSAIMLKWRVIDTDGRQIGGIEYKLDNQDRVIESSVGYICQSCGGFFKEKHKPQFLMDGLWIPTAEAKKMGYYSYHLNSLYAPLGMDGWTHYAQQYIEANPPGQSPDEYKNRTFVNVVLGETSIPTGSAPEASSIQKNQRDYEIGTVPELLSIKDGNGKIVLLTFACDVNGTVAGINGATENDARVDYEIVAWSETGASYSVQQGSIGTFVPKERSSAVKTDRYKWSYELDSENSVWPVVNAIARRIYKGDNGGYFRADTPCVDVGVYTDKVYAFIDWSIGRNPENPFVGARGHKEQQYTQQNQNTALFNVGKARPDIFYLQVGVLKDYVASYMKARWVRDSGEKQPNNFMNYPMSERYVCPDKKANHEALGIPYDGDLLYQSDTYFKHYESEARNVLTSPTGAVTYRWEVKNREPNHFWDCRIYNEAMRHLIVHRLGELFKREYKIREFIWVDYVAYIKGELAGIE